MFFYFPSPLELKSERSESRGAAHQRGDSVSWKPFRKAPHLGPWARPQKTLPILCCKRLDYARRSDIFICLFQLPIFSSFLRDFWFGDFWFVCLLVCLFFSSDTRLTAMHFICLINQLSGCQLELQNYRKLKLSLTFPHALHSIREQHGHNYLPRVN